MSQILFKVKLYKYNTCTNVYSVFKLIGEGRQQVNVRIQLAGLPASSMDVFRGIHVHEFGDIGDQCARVGPHFNPSQTPHGSRRNFAL